MERQLGADEATVLPEEELLEGEAEGVASFSRVDEDQGHLGQHQGEERGS